ncbi:MAG: tail fiber domain-containing protein [Rickettsiales bacterium]|nr:tail fiber domain-containing protein [Rickettsiales bacterium]
MKTFNFIKFGLILSLTSVTSLFFVTNAQINYGTNGFLTFGNTSTHHDGSKNYDLTLRGNVWIAGPASGHFLQIDTNPAATRIASHSDQVVFYNTQTSTFNAIQVSAVYTHSDARSKTNISNVSNGLSTILKLRPVAYDLINKDSSNKFKLGGSGKEIGLLAQEVEAVLPEIVLTDDEGKKLINYTALVPVLIDAIKTLQAEIDALKKQ